MTLSQNSILFYYYEIFHEVIIFSIDDGETCFNRILNLSFQYLLRASNRNLKPGVSYPILHLLVYSPRTMLYYGH